MTLIYFMEIKDLMCAVRALLIRKEEGELWYCFIGILTTQFVKACGGSLY